MRKEFVNPFWGLITLDMQYQDYCYMMEQEGETPLNYQEWLHEDEEIL